jgi:hypothetical protein
VVIQLRFLFREAQEVWFLPGEKQMDTFIEFASIGITTILALFAALALQAFLLRVTFALMQPAAAARRVPTPAIEHGTRMTAHAYAKAR